MASDIDQTVLDLDELMDRILEDPTLATPEDIDAVIAHHRKYRAQIEGGAKPKKATKGVTLNLESLGLVIAAEPIKRRI